MRKNDSDRIEKWAATSLTTALTLLLTLTLCGPAVAQSTAFNENGAFASVLGFCSVQTSIECITVQVFASSTNGRLATFLFYDHTVSDLNTQILLQDTSGSGYIPNSAFQVHGQTASLNVNTSTGFGQLCTFDPSTGMEITCNPVGGVVTGTWTVIPNVDTEHSTVTTRQTFPNAISNSTGTFDSQAALASVNVLGAALANVTGQVGKTTNAAISVQIVRH